MSRSFFVPPAHPAPGTLLAQWFVELLAADLRVEARPPLKRYAPRNEATMAFRIRLLLAVSALLLLGFSPLQGDERGDLSVCDSESIQIRAA